MHNIFGARFSFLIALLKFCYFSIDLKTLSGMHVSLASVSILNNIFSPFTLSLIFYRVLSFCASHIVLIAPRNASADSSESVWISSAIARTALLLQSTDQWPIFEPLLHVAFFAGHCSLLCEGLLQRVHLLWCFCHREMEGGTFHVSVGGWVWSLVVLSAFPVVPMASIDFSDFSCMGLNCSHEDIYL